MDPEVSISITDCLWTMVPNTRRLPATIQNISILTLYQKTTGAVTECDLIPLPAL